MLILGTTTDKIQVTLNNVVTTNQLDCIATYKDITTSAYSGSAPILVKTNNTSNVDLVSAPACNTQRIVDFINIYNNDVVNAIVTVTINRNGSSGILFKCTLATNELLTYVEGQGWKIHSNDGLPKQSLSYDYINTPNVVSVLDFIPSTEHNTIKAGTSTYNCQPNIQAAIDHLFSLFGKGDLYFPPGRYWTTSTIIQKSGVTLSGPANAWTNITGTSWNNGAVIYKAHNGDCIQSGIGTQVIGVAIKNLAIQSNSTTYPSGAAINYGKVVEARLDSVNVFRVGGDGIIFGDNSTDTWHLYMNDCYVNNPLGRAFVIGTKWFRGKNIRSDNGTIGCELLTSAQEATLESFHFEGWQQNALKISGGNIQTIGRCISANTLAGPSAVHVNFVNVSGSFITTLRGIHFFGESAKAVQISGNQNILITVEDCSIENTACGVDVNGDSCSIRNNNFYQCGYAFRQNASNLIFSGNTTSLTLNTQVGEFVAGTKSTYTDNKLDKQLNNTGLILNSNTNTASNNKGWTTKTGGTTPAITSGTAVAHGLSFTPTEVHATPTTGGWTSFHIVSDATNLYFNHTGTSVVQFHWTARLACDRQS